jgi:hypothetical protein
MEHSAADPMAPLVNDPTACLAMGWTVHLDADQTAHWALDPVVAGRAGYADPPEHAAVGPPVYLGSGPSAVLEDFVGDCFL